MSSNEKKEEPIIFRWYKDDCKKNFHDLTNRIKNNLAEEKELLNKIKNLRDENRHTLESIQEVLATDFDKLIAELGVDETGVPVE